MQDDLFTDNTSDDEKWNLELELEVRIEQSLVVFSRDWTVETIVSQVINGNIELNPKFQRRNAWNDVKRSRLLESLLLGIPVPEIVLAEDLSRKKSYIVIDGKQRLLALLGYIRPDKFQTWDKPALKLLQSRSDLNGKQFEELAADNSSGDRRELLNSDIRCTMISNYSDVGVLYDIFYRLNSGSVPLSSQELRQALNKGDFADFLIYSTNERKPIQTVLRIQGPDKRLRDAELLLRFISFKLFSVEYDGNLTPFLDRCMKKINLGWDKYRSTVEALSGAFDDGIVRLIDTYPTGKVGRKFVHPEYESRFNRALFEVQIYYFSELTADDIVRLKVYDFEGHFRDLCEADIEFMDSIESSTKNIPKYRTRFGAMANLLSAALGRKIESIPLPE